MDYDKIWHKTLEEIKPQVGPANFKGWFSHTKIDNIEGSQVTLTVPSAFFESQLKARYFNIINQSLEKVLGLTPQLNFKVVSTSISKKSSQPGQYYEEDIFEFTSQSAISHFLNSKYTLDNFVVGLSNNVAFAAAQAVIQNPGTSYNPLLIYGGTGVGKTHLMLGIGNQLIKKNPSLKIIYCSSEQFTNDYVYAIQTHKMGELRNKYRSSDLFLVDDIQFFSGREGTQEEFFHTFNELTSKNSQIILTSDRPPNEIAKVEDRLKSRFQGGLMVDIQLPDFDTRVAILKAKCLERGDNLPEDAVNLIASSINTNIRELEGRLMQIIQTLKAQNQEPTIENISTFFQTPQKAVNFDHKQVILSVCQFFDLTQKDLTGPKRQKGLVLPRHLVMFLLCEELGMTVERVGQLLGGRDHTTVMHGRDRIKNLLNTDREVQRVMIEVKRKLAS